MVVLIGNAAIPAQYDECLPRHLAKETRHSLRVALLASLRSSSKSGPKALVVVGLIAKVTDYS